MENNKTLSNAIQEAFEQTNEAAKDGSAVLDDLYNISEDLAKGAMLKVLAKDAKNLDDEWLQFTIDNFEKIVKELKVIQKKK